MDFVTVFFAVFTAEVCKTIAEPFIHKWIRPLVKRHIDSHLRGLQKENNLGFELV